MISLLSDTATFSSHKPPSRPVLQEIATPDASGKLVITLIMLQIVMENMKKGIHMKGYQDYIKKDSLSEN